MIHIFILFITNSKNYLYLYILYFISKLKIFNLQLIMRTILLQRYTLYIL